MRGLPMPGSVRPLFASNSSSFRKINVGCHHSCPPQSISKSQERQDPRQSRAIRASIIWNWARLEGLTSLAWPAAGMEKSGWKNKEKARTFEVTDALFDAVYEKADQVLKDCMDIATATALRITDARTVAMPVDGKLRINASKTGKAAHFDVDSSPTLSAIVARRKAIKASHVMLLSTPTGRPVTYALLRARWEDARKAAAKKAQEAGNDALAREILAMYLRDMRKRASDLVETVEEAAQLLQHSSIHVTRKHYRSKAEKLRAVR